MANRYKGAIFHLFFVMVAVNASGGHYAGSRTVFPAEPFYLEEDAETLKNAMDGCGTNERAIIDVLTKRDVNQRLEIALSYKNQYGSDLIDDLAGELSGELMYVILAMMTPRPQLYARELHKAVDGLGTDEETIIEIICSLNNHEIHEVAAAYEEEYHQTLKDALMSDTSGRFRKLLVSLVQGNREESPGVDEQLARNEAQALSDAGVEQWGTDESVFQRILVTRSYHQLWQTFFEYKTLTEHTIEEAIESEFADESKALFLAIVKCVVNRNEFFAEKLHASIEGLGTNDRTLIRIIVTRSELDLGDIKEAYSNRYGTSLEDSIGGDTSGDYLYALYSLVY